MNAQQMPGAHEGHGLVEHQPVLDAVAEAVGQHLGVIGQPAYYIAVGPASAGLQGAGQIPVKHGQPRGAGRAPDSHRRGGREVEAAAVDGPSTGGQHPAPGGGKAEIGQAQAVGQVEVFGPAMVKIGADAGVLAALDGAAATGKIVPYAGAFALLLPGALYLIGGAGGAPVKSGPKSARENGSGAEAGKNAGASWPLASVVKSGE